MTPKERQEIIQYLVSIALSDYHLDATRIDAARVITEFEKARK